MPTVYAADPLGIKKVTPATSGLYQNELRDVIPLMIKWLLSIAAVLALLAMVVGGLQYIISFGVESKTASAKKIIFFALVGLLVIGVSFSILLAVESFLKGNP